MELNNLQSLIIKQFDTKNLESKSEVEYIKNRVKRDVVTKIDLDMHQMMELFCATEIPGTIFISEEDWAGRHVWRDLVTFESALIVDPLDGSNNLVCGFTEFGSMAAILKKGEIVESLVVLPHENQILSWQKEVKLSMTQPVDSSHHFSAPVYLAYSPRMNKEALRARSEILDYLEGQSAGVYRYGSACVGLYRTFTGQHSSFVGLEMRPWDVLSFFPILVQGGLKLAYSASQDEVTVVASWNDDVFAGSKELLTKKFGNFVISTMVITSR